jgi:hypothetical protein
MKYHFVWVSILALFLTSCSTNREHTKSSSSKNYYNKSYYAQKRKPVYNNKYIKRAKKNVIEGNLDEEENDDEEYVDLYVQNRMMYDRMIEQEYMKRMQQEAEMKKSESKITESDQKQVKLEQDLAEIKKMLNVAKNDLVKYRCPLEESRDVKSNSRYKTQVKKKDNIMDVMIKEKGDNNNYNKPKSNMKMLNLAPNNRI